MPKEVGRFLNSTICESVHNVVTFARNSLFTARIRKAFMMKVTHIQQCCIWTRKRAKTCLVTCIMLAVVVNIILLRALYSDDWRYISFFKAAKQQSYQPSRLQQDQNSKVNQTQVEFPKCMFYKSSSNDTLFDYYYSHYVTMNVKGRLGNQMFEYASLLGIAAQHGFTPFFRRKSLLFSAFQSQEYFHHVSMRNDLSFEERNAGMYDCRIHNLTHSKNITLNGYFQSWKYFHHIRRKVRQLFKFRDDIVRRAKMIINKFHPGNRTLIGVHVRRGDMNTRRELQRGYKVPDLTYFRKVFEYFRYEIENALFIVVSDSVSWVKENLLADDVVISETGIPYLDMAILAQCKHSVVSSGTFGWWGAYLAGGKTVYFKDYPQPNSWLSAKYNTMDYYPPNWIPM